MALIRPTYMVDSIYSIRPEKLKLLGISYVLSDLDNTLIPWNSEKSTEEFSNYVDELKRYHIELVIVSNNSYERVKKAIGDIDVKIIARAKKPLPNAINKFLDLEIVEKDRVIVVGDQLLTDIVAGNLAGVRTVLVKPLVDTDAKKTRVNRFFEKPLLKWMEATEKK